MCFTLVIKMHCEASFVLLFCCRKNIRPLIFFWQRLIYTSFLLLNIAREEKLSLLFVKVILFFEIESMECQYCLHVSFLLFIFSRGEFSFGVGGLGGGRCGVGIGSFVNLLIRTYFSV